jgi:hypothetical protein
MKVWKSIAVGFGALLLIVLLTIPWSGGSDLAGNVNVLNIRKIRLGMTQAQVIELLGEPFSVEKKSIEYWPPNSFVMHYSRPGQRARWYPMLWIHLKDDKVEEVYAKRYIFWGVDDEGVYLLDGRHDSEGVRFTSTFPN